MSKTKAPPHETPRSGRKPPHGRAGGTPSPYVWLIVAFIAAVVAGLVWVNRPGGSDTTGASAPYTGGDLHSFVSVPGEAGRLYVGGHQAVSASSDGGATWVPVNTLEDADAMGWAFLDGAIWMGGHPGLEVSTDGGRTFEQRNDGLPATDIHALGGMGSTLYAASPAAGFLASTDGGATWEIRNPGVGQSFMGAMLVDPSNPDRILAPDMGAGAVESIDGGRTWRALGGVPGAMSVSWDLTDTDVIVVTGSGNAALSRDGGASWRDLPIPAGASIVQIDTNDPDTWYAATWMEDGTVDLSRSTDGGSTWTPL
ncbi:MAG: hypothetical protein WD096_11205 [Actinomycetota bacterium]